MTFVLMLVIIIVSTGSREQGRIAGIAIGGTIGFEALFGGPISVASMNPARSIGPALVSSHIEHLWIYLTAPILGVSLAIPVWKLIANQTPKEIEDMKRHQVGLRYKSNKI